WAYLMCRLRSGKLTMAELRRLTGILAEARKKREQEKQKSNAPESEAIGPTTSSSEGSDALDQSNRDNHGRRHLEAIGDHDKEYHRHDEFRAGDPCPEDACGGRLYEALPQVFVTISAKPPFKATEHTVDQL